MPLGLDTGLLSLALFLAPGFLALSIAAIPKTVDSFGLLVYSTIASLCLHLLVTLIPLIYLGKTELLMYSLFNVIAETGWYFVLWLIALLLAATILGCILAVIRSRPRTFIERLAAGIMDGDDLGSGLSRIARYIEQQKRPLGVDVLLRSIQGNWYWGVMTGFRERRNEVDGIYLSVTQIYDGDNVYDEHGHMFVPITQVESVNFLSLFDLESGELHSINDVLSGKRHRRDKKPT